MIKLSQAGPSGGDCTAPYNVETDCKTVGDFISEKLSAFPHEWGNIQVIEGKDTGQWMYFSSQCKATIEYKRGALQNPLLPNIASMKINKVRAHGGWSNMDYMVFADVCKPDCDSCSGRFSTVICADIDCQGYKDKKEGNPFPKSPTLFDDKEIIDECENPIEETVEKTIEAQNQEVFELKKYNIYPAPVTETMLPKDIAIKLWRNGFQGVQTKKVTDADGNSVWGFDYATQVSDSLGLPYEKVPLSCVVDWLIRNFELNIMIDKDFATDKGWHFCIVQGMDFDNPIQGDSEGLTREEATIAAVNVCVDMICEEKQRRAQIKM